MFNLKVDGQLFLCMGGGVHEKGERGKKILKNKWFSVWMDLSETISSVYTPAVGTRRAWASWPAGSGGNGRTGSPVCTSGSQLEKEGGREGGRGGGGGGAIFSVVEPLGRLGWYMETPAQHVLHQWTISMLLVERGGEVGIPPMCHLFCGFISLYWALIMKNCNPE